MLDLHILRFLSVTRSGLTKQVMVYLQGFLSDFRCHCIQILSEKNQMNTKSLYFQVLFLFYLPFFHWLPSSQLVHGSCNIHVAHALQTNNPVHWSILSQMCWYYIREMLCDYKKCLILYGSLQMCIINCIWR